MDDFEGRCGSSLCVKAVLQHLLQAVVNTSSFSKPSCTIRICSGGYSRASANASVAGARSHVSNSYSRVSKTGMRS